MPGRGCLQECPQGVFRDEASQLNCQHGIPEHNNEDSRDPESTLLSEF